MLLPEICINIWALDPEAMAMQPAEELEQNCADSWPPQEREVRNDCGDLIASQDFAQDHFALPQILGLPTLAWCSLAPSLPGLVFTGGFPVSGSMPTGNLLCPDLSTREFSQSLK